ncbi:GAF domain-containing protein [Phosphitispora sp. TUW77]|uniref:GAF domain-containing protein n=1 Tax=Phosphitispora sp. TUW77 TaxID=3152361 RepID=UPI003AB416D6
MTKLNQNGEVNAMNTQVPKELWTGDDYHLFCSQADMREILEGILEQMSQLVECDVAIVWLLTGYDFRLAASLGISDLKQQSTYRMPMDLDPLLTEMFANEKPAIWNKEKLANKKPDQYNYSPFNDVWRVMSYIKEVHSGITAPLVYRGQPLGMLVLLNKKRDYTKRDAQSVMAFANQVAVTMENARLYSFARRHAAQLEVKSQVGQKITAILDLDQLLSEVVRLIQDKFGYYHVILFLSDKNTNEVVLRECIGEHAERLKSQGLRIKVGEHGIVGNVALTGQPFLCNDVSKEPIYLRHELMPETQSELAVPLQFGNVVVGVLDVQSKQPNTFLEDDITTFQILGGQIAVALENARLFKETRHQLEVMRVLYNISVDISSQLKLQHVFNTIVTQAASSLNAQGSTLAVSDPETNLTRIVALHNVPSEYGQRVVGPGTPVNNYVLATGKPVIINDTDYWRRNNLNIDSWSDNFMYQPRDAILSVPLIWEGQAIGALTVMNIGEGRYFTDDDARFLSLLANLASAALNNAHLYDRLEQMVKERTSELAEAREELAKKADQLQQLLAATVYTQEEERTRIARDLHDEHNQLITGTLFGIQAARESIQDENIEEAMEEINNVEKLLLKIEAENKRIITGLRPIVLESHGLEAALYWLIDTCQKYCEAVCRIQVSGQPFRLTPHVETTVFRIVQESLNNVVAHASAGSVNILLDFKSDRLCIQITDDGQGFDTGSLLTKKQMGLIGMQERAQSIGGQLKILSEPGQGTRVMLDLPVPMKNVSPETKLDSHLGGLKTSTAIEDISEIARAIEELDNEKALLLVKKAMKNGIDPNVLHNGVLVGLKAIETRFENILFPKVS